MAAAWTSMHVFFLYTKTHTTAVCSPDRIDAWHERNQEQLDRLAIYIYTGCPRRNGQNFGRVFLMLKYTEITQNTYVQS